MLIGNILQINKYKNFTLMDNNLIKNILIKQPAGIGDIFFCQKIAYALYEVYNVEIIWPVIPEFIWIKDYIKVPFIKFVNWNEEYEGKEILLNNDISIPFLLDNYLIIPLQRADWNYPGISVMDAKYKLVDLDFEDWSYYFNFERKIEKENELYYNILKLTDDSEYCFVSRNYGSPPNYEVYPFKYEKELRIIEMSFIEGYTIFDWCKVIENASEIYTVDSSINYIIDKLVLKTEDLTLIRKPFPNQTAKHLFKKNYKLYNL